MKDYSRGSHTTYHHRFHIVWITKYRYKVLRGALQRRVRDIIAQVAEEYDVHIVNGVVSSDHVHILVSIPPHVRESDLVKVMKGRSSRKVQQELIELPFNKIIYRSPRHSQNFGNICPCDTFFQKVFYYILFAVKF